MGIGDIHAQVLVFNLGLWKGGGIYCGRLSFEKFFNPWFSGRGG
jgi:hypothetical protein